MPDPEHSKSLRAGPSLGDSVAGPRDRDSPTSEMRPLDALSRVLHLATRLRGVDAEAALVSVSDASGVLLYEGPLCADGTIRLPLDAADSTGVVRVTLETARSHRQADVLLCRGVVTEHAFT